MKTKTKYFIHKSSYVDKNVQIGEGTKVWHFAHKGKICHALLDKKPADVEYKKKLFDFTNKFTDKIELKQTNSKKFLCNICKRTHNKENGIRWQGNDYVCKDCYLNMDKTNLEFK